jgi:large subunit ribosomal protein L40e
MYMQIHIEHFAFDKILSLRVHPTDTVASLKHRIKAHQRSLHVNQQELVCGDRTLIDHLTLLGQNIQDDALLQLRIGSSMRIFVRFIGHNTITLDVSTTDAVNLLKQRIADRIGVNKEEIKVSFRGIQLQDKNTLSYYHIQDESTLFSPVKKQPLIKDAMNVFIKNSNNGETMQVKAKPFESVFEFKIKVTEKTSIPIDRFWLKHEGKRLGDEHPLSKYNVRKDSTISLIIRSTGCIGCGI